jgi:hypothetical protein
LYMFLTFDIRGINDIRLISRPIHAPSHELEDTDTNTPHTSVISKSILVELQGIREESVILYLWGMNPLAYFILLFYVEACCLHIGVWLPTPFASFPLQFPSRASPCAITFQLDSTSICIVTTVVVLILCFKTYTYWSLCVVT